MTETPAGWYPDPTPASAAPSVRYWDGQAWTEHVAHSAQPAYAQPAYAPPVGPTTPDGAPLASWWARVGAHLIDLVIVGGVGTLVTLPSQISMNDDLNVLMTELDAEEPDFAAFWSGYLDIMREMMLWQLPVMVLALVYYVVMLRWKGATIGKLALGLKVRRRDEPGQLPWSAIALRVGFQNLQVIVILLLALGAWQLALGLGAVLWLVSLLDILWPLWDSKRQALHDKVARTNVVKAR